MPVITISATATRCSHAVETQRSVIVFPMNSFQFLWTVRLKVLQSFLWMHGLNLCPLHSPFFFDELCSNEHFDPFEHEPFDVYDLQCLLFPSPAYEEYASVALSRERSFCRQNTHSHDTFVRVQRITERTAQMFHSRNTRGSRLKIAHCSVSKTTCHPSVMSHTLPHLPQNTSTRSLSPTSPVFRTSSPSLTCPISVHSGLEYETLRHPRRSGGYTNSAPPTGYEPKLT